MTPSKDKYFFQKVGVLAGSLFGLALGALLLKLSESQPDALPEHEGSNVTTH